MEKCNFEVFLFLIKILWWQKNKTVIRYQYNHIGFQNNFWNLGLGKCPNQKEGLPSSDSTVLRHIWISLRNNIHQISSCVCLYLLAAKSYTKPQLWRNSIYQNTFSTKLWNHRLLSKFNKFSEDTEYFFPLKSLSRRSIGVPL